jgi:hypothetical protein
MSEPDDLLGKADAFLKRYRPTSSAARSEVPVLTEVIAEAPATPAQPGPAAAPQEGQETKTDLAELEHRLKQSILDAVASHVAKVVEEPLKSRLDAQLQRALVTVSAQVKADLEALIRDAVTRAVEAEIARARGPSRGG